MIVKTEIAGGYVWIEHDDSVGLESRIFTLHTSAPGHPSFSMGWALARSVVKELWILTGGAVAENTTDKELVAETLDTVLEWVRGDVTQHGPGPSGGYRARVQYVERAIEQLKRTE